MTLVWLAGAWLAGIAAAATFGRGAWLLAIALLAAALAHALISRRRAAVAAALVLPLLFGAGAVRYEAAQPSPSHDDVARFNAGPHVRLRAVLRDDPLIGDTSQRLSLDARALQLDGAWRDASGGVLARVPLLPRHRAGDILELEGKLATPPQLDGFDYASYLARQGIGSVIEYPVARRIGHDEPPPLRAATLRVRRTLSASLGRVLPEPEASLAQGVLLGQRSALPDDVRDDLNTTSTSHLVVVSGSNVALVSSYVTLVLAGLFGRRRALLLSLVAVGAYALLVGASPPVLRASIMGALLVGATLAGRPTHGLTSIVFAAAVMAAISPHVIGDVSFQLSFAATAAIVYLSPPLRRSAIDLAARLLRRDELPRWTAPLFFDPLAVTLAAIAGTAPLLALHFGRASLVALPANLLVVPAFPLILAAALVAAVGGLLPTAGLALAAPAHFLLAYWLAVADALAAVPAASVALSRFDLWWAAAVWATLAAGAFAWSRRARTASPALLEPSMPLRWRVAARRAAFAAPALALVTSGFALWPHGAHRLQVTVLDVGQGDAILIETPDGRQVLVDGGPGRAVLRGLGDELSWYDRTIDLVVVTQPQSDHAGGLLDVLARYDVRAVMTPPLDGTSPLVSTLRDAVRRERSDVIAPTAGTSVDLGDGVRLDVLWPPEGYDAADVNARSTVLLLSWRDVRFLFTADIGASVERALLERGEDLHADVLKVPHHGSRSSSTQPFLAAVDPAVAVVSAGRDNPFGHPAPDVVARLERHAWVFSTADHGAVRIETDGERLWIETAAD
jgi:competence protein ComEC